MQWLVKQWYSHRRLSTCYLWPFSVLYRWAMACRTWAYRRHLLKQYRCDFPVIVVGNITVGGSGKTPLVLAIVKWLQQQGYKPGIVSRGYGGQAQSWPQTVTAKSDPKLVGDEPVMMANSSNCPVVVAPNRPHAIEQLIQQYDCNVIISDDGLQHLAMQRDIEIAVIDGVRRLGNGCCLPAGPLREPAHRLQSVDFIVANGQAIQPGEHQMQLQAGALINLREPQYTKPLSAYSGQTVHAIAGIGYPQRFFSQLQASGLTVLMHPFPDHHQYTPQELKWAKDKCVIMTAKDAVKCRQFAGSNWWFLPIEAQLPDSFFQAIQKKISLA